MRIRSKWLKGTASVTDNANALAYIIWQIALEQTKNLHREDFIYHDDTQRMNVLKEYLFLLVHIADRLTFQFFDTNARRDFVTTLAQSTARHLQRNLEDVWGHDQDYKNDYIANLNKRIEEYSELGFTAGEPSYSMLRTLGRHIQDLMGANQTNRWIIDHVMEIDAKTAIVELKKGLDNLLGTTTILDGFRAPE
ncbi:MAG: hypothetical protein ACI8P9_005298 [Parasphingorhabdus sp.]|jgi:hypothetical protein